LKGFQDVKLLGMSLKIIENSTVRSVACHFLLVIFSNHVSILRRFWGTVTCLYTKLGPDVTWYRPRPHRGL